jgi:hypothetical protein
VSSIGSARIQLCIEICIQLSPRSASRGRRGYGPHGVSP